MTKPLYIVVGVDCDPDRSEHSDWLGMSGIMGRYEDYRLTANFRCDSQHVSVGDAEQWDSAHGAFAWHLHYLWDGEERNMSVKSIDGNIKIAQESGFKIPKAVHMGWCRQSAYSLVKLADVGVEIDYSPIPGLEGWPINNVQNAPWIDVISGMKMIPAFTYHDAWLNLRTMTKRTMLTMATSPMLYGRLLDAFFREERKYFLTYVHADEIGHGGPYIDGWKKHLYSPENFKRNYDDLIDRAVRAGYEPKPVTIYELAEALWPTDASS